jgi:hypothetical protein
MDYYEVVQFVWSYYREGDKGIPLNLYWGEYGQGK